jgi:hypothetical protein
MGDHHLGSITKLKKRKTLMETLRSRKEKGQVHRFCAISMYEFL